MAADDDRLYQVLDDLIARARRGEAIHLDVEAQKYPDLAVELRNLWGTVVVAENFGLSALSATREPSPAPNGGSPKAAALPRTMGDYELLEEIGRGGMGIVYRARQQSLNRTVAVKMLLLGDLAAPANLKRFQAEAAASAQFDHPSLVPVYEVGEENGHPYFSMPLIEGDTLASRIAERPLPQREAAQLLIPVCRAVSYAHERGIIHRDLKPSNILIDRSGHPYVSDFGLAKQLERVWTGAPMQPPLTETGAILGTPGYMAPEQAAGQRGNVGVTTDVYSLGAILYAAVTGRPPFQAATPVDALLMVLDQDVPPPRLLNPKLDVDLELIILKALQKPADLRYASPSDLADDLEAYLANEPVAARSSQFSQVLSRAFRPTHHAAVLQNWGVLWMWHAAVLLVLCVTTDLLRWHGERGRLPYLALWTLGLGAWGIIFWNLRRRSGPVTFVERQIAHIWAASMACCTALFGVEALLKLPVLTLSPVLALFAAAVFVVKAGILSGEFYWHAGALFLTAIPMALVPAGALTIFGLVSGSAFLFSGLKFHRQRRRESNVKS